MVDNGSGGVVDGDCIGVVAVKVTNGGGRWRLMVVAAIHMWWPLNKYHY